MRKKDIKISIKKIFFILIIVSSIITISLYIWYILEILNIDKVKADPLSLELLKNIVDKRIYKALKIVDYGVKFSFLTTMLLLIYKIAFGSNIKLEEYIKKNTRKSEILEIFENSLKTEDIKKGKVIDINNYKSNKEYN